MTDSMDASNNRFDVNKRIAEIRNQINIGRARSEVMRDRLGGLTQIKTPELQSALFDRLFSGYHEEVGLPNTIPMLRAKEENALA